MGLPNFETPSENTEQPSELTPCNSRERVYEGGASLERQAHRSPTREENSPAPLRRLIRQVNPHRIPRSSERPPVRARERRLNATSSSSSAVANPESSYGPHISDSSRLLREGEYSAASRLTSLHRNAESPRPLEGVPEPYNPRRLLLTEASLLGNVNGGDSSNFGPDYTIRRDPRWASVLGAGRDEGEEDTSMIPNHPITTEGLTSTFNGLPRRDPVLSSYAHPYLVHIARLRHPLQRRNPAVTVGPPPENRALESPSPEPWSSSEDGYPDDSFLPILNRDSEILSPTEVMEGISPETMQATSRPISPITFGYPFQLSGVHESHWNGTPDDDSITGESTQMPPRSSAMSDIAPTAEHFEHRDQTPEALTRAEYNRLRPVYGSIIWAWTRALSAAVATSNDPFVGPVPLDQEFYELFDDLISEDPNQVEPAVRRITYLMNLYRCQWSSTPETEANLYIGARLRDMLNRDGLEREKRLWEDCIGFHLDREPGVDYDRIF